MNDETQRGTRTLGRTGESSEQIPTSVPTTDSKEKRPVRGATDFIKAATSSSSSSRLKYRKHAKRSAKLLLLAETTTTTTSHLEEKPAKAAVEMVETRQKRKNVEDDAVADVGGTSEETRQNSQQSTTNSNRPEKFCAVCGDKAIACNFNAVSCESCKAFFRRNAFKEQRLRCLFSNRCVIDRITRRFCSKCRLLKCFSIGMRPDKIMSDEQKHLKRAKIMQNKRTRGEIADAQAQQKAPLTCIEDALPSDAETPPPSSGSATNSPFNDYQQQVVEFSKCALTASDSVIRIDDDAQTQTQTAIAQQHSQDVVAQDVPRAQVEKRDVATNCPDDLFDDLPMALVPHVCRNYCAFSHQCHFCSLKLSQSSDARQTTIGHTITCQSAAQVVIQNSQQHQTSQHLDNAFNQNLLSTPRQVAESSSQMKSTIRQAPGANSFVTQANEASYAACTTGCSSCHQTSSRAVSGMLPETEKPQIRSTISSSEQQRVMTEDVLAERETISVSDATSPNISTELASKVAGSSGETRLDSATSSASPSLITWLGETYCLPAETEHEVQARIERLGFSDSELQIINEMLDAAGLVFESNGNHNADADTRQAQDESPMEDFVSFCDGALRRLIKTLKQLSAFRLLGRDDQILLLKNACFKILLLRSTFNYDDELEGWRDRCGRVVPLKALKREKSDNYERHKAIMDKLTVPLRKDRLLMAFMLLLIFFDPTVNSKHSSSVGLDNMIYLYTLRKYLVGTQPEPLAKYDRILETLQLINACNEGYNRFFSQNYQPEEITPLLIEIFDISIND